MSIKKLLHPLIIKGKQIYPLTSADQVIKSNGDRLENNGKINADTFNGFEPSYFLENAKGSISINIDGTEKVDNIVDPNIALLQAVYPIGSIYLSVNDINPSVLFNFGTWEKIKDKFLLGSGDTYNLGIMGGEAEHTLTVDEMPSHNHSFVRQQWFTVDAVESSSTGSIFSWKSGTGGTTSASYTGQPTKSSGGSQAHNNMPPYITINIWKRIA